MPKDGGEENLAGELIDQARPVARFLGHSLAAALGFCLLALILLIPILAVRLLERLGFGDLAQELRPLEKGLLYVDLLLFGFAFAIGAIEFLVLGFLDSWYKIKAKAQYFKKG